MYPPCGMLIDVSRTSDRGEVTLLGANDHGWPGAAVMDVLEGETKLNSRNGALQNVMLQLRHASGRYEARQAMGKLARDNLTAHRSVVLVSTPAL